MNIIITGRSRVGKDTVASIIEKLYGKDNVNLISLADPLKNALSSALSLRVSDIDMLKNSGTKTIVGKEMRKIICDLSDSLLNDIGQNTWCEIAIKKLEPNKINIITDMRYLREYNFFNNFLGNNFIIIKVVKDQYHIPLCHETLIPFNFNIINNSTIDELENKVKFVLETIENNYWSNKIINTCYHPDHYKCYY